MSLNNLIVKSPDTLVEVQLLEGGLEVADHLPEVVEEGAELDEAEIHSAAKSFWKEAVPEKKPHANLSNWCIIRQFILPNPNKSSRAKWLRDFGSQKLSWWTLLELGIGRLSDLL